jgi:dynactin complex subunit
MKNNDEAVKKPRLTQMKTLEENIDKALERYNKHFEIEVFEQEFVLRSEMIEMISHSIKENKTLEELYPNIFIPPVNVVI